MAITVLIKLIPGTFPEGFCPETLQEEWNKGLGLAQAVLQVDVGNSFFNFGDTTPTPENRSFPWLRTIGGRIDRWWVYSNGFWLAVFSTDFPASGKKRIGWVGTEAELKTEDGGEDAPVDDYHGPFWEVDHDFDGRSPMGPGPIQNANPVKSLSVGEDYGDGSQLVTSNQVGPHTHPLYSAPSITNNDGTIKVVGTGTGGPGLAIGFTAPETNPLAVGPNVINGGGSQERLPVIHPVIGLFQIKRTARIFLRI